MSLSFNALRAAALGSASFAALSLASLPASAQDAEAVAERFVTLFESQPDTPTTVAYESATRDGDTVVLTDVTSRADAEGVALDWTFDTVTIVGPDIARENTLQADALDMEGMTMTAPFGVFTIERVDSDDVLIGNPDGRFLMSYARQSTAENFVADYNEGGRFTIESMSATSDYDADTFGFTRQDAEVTGISVSRDDFAVDRQSHFDLFGVDEFLADASYSVTWADETFSLEELVVDSPSMGRLALSLGVGNVSPQLIDAALSQDAETMQALATALTFTGFSLTIENGDKFDTAVRRQAENVDLTEREYREKGVAQVRKAFAIFAGTSFGAAALPEMEDYLEGRADRIEIVAEPAAPVPFVAVGMTAMSSPGAAAGLLNLSVESD